MKARIHDVTTLRALGPLEVAAYLRSNGWKQVERIGDSGAVWAWRPKKGAEFELLLPLDSSLADFPFRMAEALRTLEVAEARSQLEILQDLTTSSADVIRVRAQQSNTQDGTIPIDEGVGLVQRAREMLLAAACAAVEPKSYFPTRKPPEAVEYMGKVRLGQTERGSYVVTLISRVPPRLQPDQTGQEHLDVMDPFERQVTRMLARSLAAMRRAVLDSMTIGSFEAFQRVVSEGVSANLCDAVAAMAGGSAGARDLAVDFTWSRLRPIETEEPRHIQLSADAVPAIEEAGRIFRERSPRRDFELVGGVIKLERPDTQQPGRATIFGAVDGAPRRVTVELDEAEYQLAIRAHAEGRLVRCLGQLVKSGKLFELHKPHCFDWADDE